MTTREELAAWVTERDIHRAAAERLLQLAIDHDNAADRLDDDIDMGLADYTEDDK